MRLFFCSLVVMMLAVGCGSDNSPMGTAGTGGSRGPNDGGVGGSIGCEQVPALGGELGGQCRGEALDCNGSLVCLNERTFELGGPNDPIRDYPPGEDQSFEIAEFPGNYCTLALTPSATACTQDNAAACDAVCGVCTPAFLDADICLRQCQAEAGTNSSCRDGYECDLLLDVCDFGCSSDDDCRVFREDTIENGELDPWDPMTMTGDQLVYDTESTYVCNPSTNRCEHPGKLGAEAGHACTDDQECEANGICLDEDFFEFPLGYCSKIRCDIDPCGGDGICADLGLGVPLCAERCTVGSGATPGDPNTYLDNTQGCRDGYTCFWTGSADDPADRAGVCVPGVFNDVIGNNIGDTCAEDSDCYSPFGQGACASADLIGCTVFDCAVPGMPDDVCGENAECVSDGLLSLCVAKCSAADNCLEGAACADFDLDPSTLDSVCWPLCLADSECRVGEEICNNLGECAPAP